MCASRLAPLGSALFAVVDEALERGDRSLAEDCVLLEAGHGRVSDGWRVSTSLQPWRQGRPVDEVFAATNGLTTGAVGGGTPLSTAFGAAEPPATVQVGSALFDVMESVPEAW